MVEEITLGLAALTLTFAALYVFSKSNVNRTRLEMSANADIKWGLEMLDDYFVMYLGKYLLAITLLVLTGEFVAVAPTDLVLSDYFLLAITVFILIIVMDIITLGPKALGALKKKWR